ncbi:MAG: hypothetical protein KDK27_10815, partial [Leptospiraceae bacterium]|nr:hypothetical protein [Leptospiraceae bacterium]
SGSENDSASGGNSGSDNDSASGGNSGSENDSASGGNSGSENDSASDDDHESDDEEGYATLVNCKQRSYDLDSSQGKWYSDPGKGNAGPEGIYTYWQRQPLTLRVKGNCASGWFEMEVKARNIHGPLPEFYKEFSIDVTNQTDNIRHGTLLIDASDTGYKTGSLYVYLGKGDSDIALDWTNDAYKKDEYDANLQIHSIKLKPVKGDFAHSGSQRQGYQSCKTEGRFFYDESAGTARTYWANQTIAYCFDDLEPGKYEVSLEARNYGAAGLPDNYEYFKVVIAADGVAQEVMVPASDDKFETGLTMLDLRGGDIVVGVTWTNDRYKEGEFDANIEIKSIQLQRVGASERSGLTAYLGQGNWNLSILIGTIVVALLGLGIVQYLRRRQAA